MADTIRYGTTTDQEGKDRYFEREADLPEAREFGPGLAIIGDTTTLKVSNGATWRAIGGSGVFPFRESKTVGYLVDKFNDLTGFSAASGNAAGSFSLLTGGGPDGQNVIRMTVTADAASNAFRLNKNVVLPVAKFTTRSGFFVQAIRVQDWTKVVKLAQFFFLTGGSQYYQRFPAIYYSNTAPNVANAVMNNEWFYVVWSGVEMAAGGGAAAFASNTLDTASIRFGIHECLAGAVVDFGPLWYAEKQTKPVVTFSFDDSNKTDITTAKPILDRFGFRATTHTIRDQIGQTNFLSIDDLQKLHEAGWDVGVHGAYSHTDTLLTYDAILSDISYNMGILNIAGLPMSQSYAYPEGDHNPDSIAALRALGFKCAGTVQATPKPISYQDPLAYMRSGTSGKTAAALKTEVDSVISRGGHLDFFTHGLYNSGGVHTTEAIFEEVVEYVAEKVEAGQLEAGFTASEYFK